MKVNDYMASAGVGLCLLLLPQDFIKDIFNAENRFHFPVWKAVVAQHRRVVLNEVSRGVSYKAFIIREVNVVKRLTLGRSFRTLGASLRLRLILILLAHITVHVFNLHLLLQNLPLYLLLFNRDEEPAFKQGFNHKRGLSLFAEVLFYLPVHYLLCLKLILGNFHAVFLRVVLQEPHRDGNLFLKEVMAFV